MMSQQTTRSAELPNELQVSSELFQACAIHGNYYCDDLYQHYRRHFQGNDNTPDDHKLEPSSKTKQEAFQQTVRHIYGHYYSFRDDPGVPSSKKRPRYHLQLTPLADRPLVNIDNDNNYYEEDAQKRRHLQASSHNIIELDESSIYELGYIYYPKPYHGPDHHRHHKHKRNRKEEYQEVEDDTISKDRKNSISIKGVEPPPTLKVRNKLAKSDKSGIHPFGDTLDLPNEDVGLEVNLKPSNSFRYPPNAPAMGNDPFRTHLNWATQNNPDGVALVHNVFDQKFCGSCWAYAATGSLEASAARQAAREAYWEEIDRLESQQSSFRMPGLRKAQLDDEAFHAVAREHAQWVEEATFANTNLSIQELLDCDTIADQGCVGGNPLLAFFYMHRHGLVSWNDYPYTAEEGECGLKNKSIPPRATVASWGILPKNHEDVIAIALRFIGPVAVGINGGDRDFVSYSGGIFDKSNCPQHPNHAMLLVGYGQETIEREGFNETVRYWIARNSWGTNWGENGFIRVQRGIGAKNIHGVCGIARSPSVALGGRALFSVSRDDMSNKTEILPFGSEGKVTGAIEWEEEQRWPFDSSGTASDASISAQRSCESWNTLGNFLHDGCVRVSLAFQQHRAAMLGVCGVALACIIAAWPLSFACRRRRRRKKTQQQHSLRPSSISLASEDANMRILEEDLALEDDEHSALLRPRSNQDGYGTAR